MRFSAALAPFALAISAFAAATPEARSLDGTSLQLSKRYDNARFTFYDVGLGACGKQNVGTDFVVALDSAQWSSGSHCFAAINITVSGKTASASIVDEFYDYDALPRLFEYFGPLSDGELFGTWNFV
ncbi:hypothetical protein FA95DRAFT_1610899 [Auriscalpium vulgare]|uniref:Uncharacterized protein n=1 Tax=Auriscalpium vulgare TaxID=40419 RepID=A0ACB8RD22_9AGAM|nr:hypothetical protein FA95DRAFT_1610899 [Auriscalpium vulgare]